MEEKYDTTELGRYLHSLTDEQLAQVFIHYEDRASNNERISDHLRHLDKMVLINSVSLILIGIAFIIATLSIRL